MKSEMDEITAETVRPLTATLRQALQQQWNCLWHGP
jgi:hypothetical protein